MCFLMFFNAFKVHVHHKSENGVLLRAKKSEIRLKSKLMSLYCLHIIVIIFALNGTMKWKGGKSYLADKHENTLSGTQAG